MGEVKYREIEKKSVLERFGLESVPAHLRTTSSIEYTMIQIAISVNAGNVLVPALAVLQGGLSFFQAVLATIIGATAAFIFVSFLALPGARYGIPAQYAIRSIMGVRGARYIASPVRTITSLYWFAVQTIGGTYLIKEIFERLTSIEVPFIPIALVMATMMATLALIGFEAVKKITKYFLPLLFIGGVVMLYVLMTADSSGLIMNLQTQDGKTPVGTMIFFASLAFVQYISGVSSSADMARYAKSTKHAYFGLLTGNTIGFTLTAILGAYTATISGNWNPYVVSSQLTESAIFIVIIFLAAILSMITINLSNAYTGGYSLLNSIPNLGRVRSAIIFGIAAITLSAFPTLVNNAQVYISWMGALIIPLSAVIVIDFTFIKKRQLTSTDSEKLATNCFSYNHTALVSILVGIVFYVCLPETLSPGFITFVVTCAFYVILMKWKRSEGQSNLKS
ncbi:purine-cytosine permease family protein [Alkalihalobacterium elongatum]|uniref:purine-cytosine permease family protein n=1 Tax=Alkalihalobacterium elongatum TaxID=2675466 RepID=UPI001C1FD3B6|nr:cytosine permease [Alkalihalobacterium elongatum]